MRRFVDLAVAVPALVVLAPALGLIAIAIRLDSRGPALFRQVRVGRDGRPFAIVKFRTMRETSDAASITRGTDDPRITRLGGILRRTRLDELPQLLNVVRGEMSLIGPRPEVPEFVARYTPEQRIALSVRPGLTGPGQLAYPTRFEPLLDGVDDPERVYLERVLGPKLELDLEYLRTRSVATDLRLIARTVRLVLGGLTRGGAGLGRLGRRPRRRGGGALRPGGTGR